MEKRGKKEFFYSLVDRKSHGIWEARVHEQ